MAEIIQHRNAEPSTSNPVAPESGLPAYQEHHGDLRRSKKKAGRKATGPRTVHGKKRSRLNALKHGLFVKDILLRDESPAEYAALLIGLLEDLQPQGRLESALVENLAAILWRKRRLFKCELAVISENVTFSALNFLDKLQAEAREASQHAVESGGLLRYRNNPFALREALETLKAFRMIVEAIGFKKDCYLHQKLYGRCPDNETPPDAVVPDKNGKKIVRVFIHYTEKFDKESNEQTTDDASQSDAPSEAECRKQMVGMLDNEIENVEKELSGLLSIENKRREYITSAAVVPGQDASERLMRYEAHLTRESERILNRLERLQRIRKGQPLPPQIDVKIT